MGRYDGQISPRVRTYSRGMLIPTRQFYASLLMEAFLGKVFQLSTTHKWGDFHAKTGVAISDKQFLRPSTHFTSLYFTSLLVIRWEILDKLTLSFLLCQTIEQIAPHREFNLLAPSLGEAGGCSAMQCNAINTLHPYRIASHYARTIHTAFKRTRQAPFGCHHRWGGHVSYSRN